MNRIHLIETITEELAGLRLDQALAKLCPQYSRSQIQHWITAGKIQIDHKTVLKNKEKVALGQSIFVDVVLQDQQEWQPESLPLDIIFEDESLIVINKPPGLVVHPGAGNFTSTLVNALLYYDPTLKKVPRAGLIHRLDKDTSGLLVVARNLSAHCSLIQQMQKRTIQRIYLAIVRGHPPLKGTIDFPIGRHPTQRTKMAVLERSGKPAITHYRCLEKFSTHSYVEVSLETGRTHQIRVHMAKINHPILGDPLYGSQRKFPHLPEQLSAHIAEFKRQALHAYKLSFIHPMTHLQQTFEAALPNDFESLLTAFRLI